MWCSSSSSTCSCSGASLSSARLRPPIRPAQTDAPAAAARPTDQSRAPPQPSAPPQARLLDRPHLQPRPRRRQPPRSPAAAPRAAPGTPCAGSRAARPGRTAPPPAPRGRASRQAAPQAGSHSCRRCCPRAALQPLQEPQPALRIRQRDLGRPRLAPAADAPHSPPPTTAARASAATLGASNRLRIATSTPSTARIRLISRVANSECPPSSKKLSSMPTRSTPSTSANSPHSSSSCGVRGARCTCRGAKLRRRQRTPVELAVRRQRQPSSTTIADGTMYSGSTCDSAARSPTAAAAAKLPPLRRRAATT